MLMVLCGPGELAPLLRHSNKQLRLLLDPLKIVFSCLLMSGKPHFILSG